jgi:hypothetical protein
MHGHGIHKLEGRKVLGLVVSIILKWMPKQKRARGRTKKTGWKVKGRP